MESIASVVGYTFSAVSVLSLVYAWLYFRQRQTWLVLWTFAFLAYTVHLAFILIQSRLGEHPALDVAVEGFALVSTILLTLGVFRWTRRPFPPLLAAPTVLLAAWMALWPATDLASIWLASPVFVYLGVLLLVAGWIVLRHAPVPGLPRFATGAALLLWGLHRFNYPVLYDVPSFLPWGYGIAMVLLMIIALGFILMHFERQHQDLLRSRCHLDALYQGATNVALVTTDLNGVRTSIQTFSPGAERLFGYTAAEAVGMPVSVLHVPRQVERLEAALAWVTAGRGFSMQALMVRKDGARFPALISLHPLRDEHARVVGTIGVALDISEQHQARRNRDILFKHTMDLFCLIGFDGRIRQINPAVTAALGWTPEQLRSRPLMDLLHEQDREATLQVVETLRRGRPLRDFENRYRTRDGGWRWLNWDAFPVPDEGVIVAVARDVTDQKWAREMLDQTRRRFANIVQSSPLGIFLYTLDDSEELILAASNAAADRFTGICTQNLHGLSITQAFPELANTDIPQRYRDCAREGAFFHRDEVPYHSRDIDGWFDVYAFQATPGEVAVLFMEVTERVRYTREREELLRTLQAQNRELESIIYASSHDLRSPLVNIQGHSHELRNALDELVGLLRRCPPPADEPALEQMRFLLSEIEESLRFVGSGAARMDVLLSGLLRLCRLGRESIEIQRVDMNRLIQDAVDAQHYQFLQSGMKVAVEPLPDCYGDPRMLSRVFANLLDNAVKYRHPDRAGEIRIAGRRAENACIYTVADNGIGIDPAHQAKVFEIFHRLDPRNSVAGDGLGLTIATRILDRLNGRIEVQSEPGQGAVFSVFLPHPDTPAASEESGAASRPVHSVQGPPAPARPAEDASSVPPARRAT